MRKKWWAVLLVVVSLVILLTGGCVAKGGSGGRRVLTKEPDRIVLMRAGKESIIDEGCNEFRSLASELDDQLAGVTPAKVIVSRDELKEAENDAVHFLFPAGAVLRLQGSRQEDLKLDRVIVPLSKFKGNVIIFSAGYELLYGPVNVKRLESFLPKIS